MIEPFASGFNFPLHPRWHDGHLWFSDVWAHCVVRMSQVGEAEVVFRHDERTTGIGFLPDGSLIVASALDRRVLRVIDGSFTVVVDLNHIGCEFLHDLAVSPNGDIYVVSRYFTDYHTAYTLGHKAESDIAKPEYGRNEGIVLIRENQPATIVASGLVNPNGLAFTPDFRELLVAESHAHCIRRFSVQRDGGLAETCPAIPVGCYSPNGISYDRAGRLWCASPAQGKVFFLDVDGEVGRAFDTGGRWALSCVVGGDEGEALYVCTADIEPGQLERTHVGDRSRDSRSGSVGRIEILDLTTVLA